MSEKASLEGLPPGAGGDGRMGMFVENVLDRHMGVGAGNRVAIVHDSSKEQLAQVLASGALHRGVVTRLLPISDFEQGLPTEVTSVLRDSSTGLAVLSSPRLWDEAGLKRFLGFRDGDPTLLVACEPVWFDQVTPADSLLRLWGHDLTSDEEYGTELLATLAANAPLRLTSPGGTDLTFVSRHWRVDHWREVHTSPVEESINGKIVADLGVYFGRVSCPIQLDIEKGRITRISCGDEDDPVFQQYRDWMRRDLAASPANYQLAEIAFGINGGAEVVGCIMEDETVRDTCHCCFGDNSRYGGQSVSQWHGGTVLFQSPSCQLPCGGTS